MPFGAIGAAVAGGVASAAVGAGISALKGSGQSSDISSGQEAARADVQPWVTTGTTANTRQADLLGLNGQPAADAALAGFKASPGYGYQVEQGLRAVDAGAAAKGMLRSGATLKAEQTLGNNLADQDFGAYIGRLNSLSTTGESAGVNQASTDTGAASNQASIYGSALNGVGNSVGTLVSSPGVQNGLTSLFSSGSGGNGAGLGTSSDLYTGGLTF